MKKIVSARQAIIVKMLSEKRLDDAEVAADRFVQQHPDEAFGWKAYGMIAYVQGQYQKAVDSLMKAIAIDKMDPETLSALGNSLQEIGRMRDSRICFDRALEIDPDCASAHNGKGVLLQKLKHTNEAMECYQRSLAINPEQCEVCYNLSSLFSALGRFDEALDYGKKAIAINPNAAEAYNNIALALQELCELDEALQAYEKAIELNPARSCIYSNQLFVLNYHHQKTGEEIFSAYQRFDERFGLPLRAQWRSHQNVPDPKRRLHLGYVSPDFSTHSSRHFLKPLLERHDRQQFELTAYAELIGTDTTTIEYRRTVDHWVPTCGLTDEEFAERIRADGIDILIDLAGHTASNRLGVFARRPAPVSVSWLGFGYTTGLSAIDYFLTDATMTPPGSEPLFAERVWRIETPSLVYRPSEGMGETGPLPASRRGHITFGCLSRGIRINRRVIEVWSEILRCLPEARLVVDSKAFATEAMQQRLTERFAAHGIASERLQIGYHSPPWDVLRGLDITLDCFPHNSGTTLIESLYMGVPFVTLAARPSVGRIGSLILTAAGHPEWIATTEDDYVDKAVALAGDPERLAAIRANLRAELEAGPWRDERGFARRVEHAYRNMWQLWCETAAPCTPDT